MFQCCLTSDENFVQTVDDEDDSSFIWQPEEGPNVPSKFERDLASANALLDEIAPVLAAKQVDLAEAAQRLAEVQAEADAANQAIADANARCDELMKEHGDLLKERDEIGEIYTLTMKEHADQSKERSDVVLEGIRARPDSADSSSLKRYSEKHALACDAEVKAAALRSELASQQMLADGKTNARAERVAAHAKVLARVESIGTVRANTVAARDAVVSNLERHNNTRQWAKSLSGMDHDDSELATLTVLQALSQRNLVNGQQVGDAMAAAQPNNHHHAQQPPPPAAAPPPAPPPVPKHAPAHAPAAAPPPAPKVDLGSWKPAEKKRSSFFKR